MLRLNQFTYLRPRSLGEAITLLQTHREDAMLMAGGTDVLPNIKHRLATPTFLVAIRDLPELQAVASDDSGLTLGAGTPLKRLESMPAILAHYPALAYSAHLISTPQVRAVGTLGGNICLDVRCNYYNQSEEWRRAIGYCMKKDSPICRVAPGGDRCWAVASADTVPVLIALRAHVSTAGPMGTRRVPLEKIYQDDGLQPQALSIGEIVTAVHLPPTDGYETVYQKFRLRQSFDFPLAAVAVSVRQDDGMVADVRIVMTAVASYPERAERAEQVLHGRPLTEATVEAAGQAVYRQAKPMDNTAGTIFHRKRMARVLTERALRAIGGLAERKLA